MKHYKQLLGSALLASALAMGSGSAYATYLPASNAMLTVTYGDYAVYLLDLLQACASNPLCQPSGPLPVPANSGDTKSYLQILTGAPETGNTPDNDKLTNSDKPIPFVVTTNGEHGQDQIITTTYFADNPFISPSGTSGGSTFVMGIPDPAPNTGTTGNDVTNFVGDRSGTWEVQVGALKTYLGSHDLVFIFDNAQEGDGASQWLNIWAEAKVYDASGVLKGCFGLNDGTISGCPLPIGPKNPTLIPPQTM